MGQVYFVRHGQTIWNVENKICGATDIALTELGHKQAVETGKKILEQGIKADEILYSPLIRAKDTALHIAEITGIPAREEARLKEQNFGKYESTPRDGAEFREAKKQFVNCYEGGESMLHLAQRIYNHKQVVDMYLMSGSFDFTIIVNGRSLQEVSRFVSENLAPMENIISTSTHFVLKTYKNAGIAFNPIDEREDFRND